MSVRALILCVFAGLAAAGCGSEIGDSCLVSTDCDPSGERTCIEQSRDGYCTILGCDYDTCPDEAVCVRFFAGEFANKTCDPVTEDDGTDDCSLDELCTISGHCVPRSAEQRFCMRKCDGDCRDAGVSGRAGRCVGRFHESSNGYPNVTFRSRRMRRRDASRGASLPRATRARK